METVMTATGRPPQGMSGSPIGVDYDWNNERRVLHSGAVNNNVAALELFEERLKNFLGQISKYDHQELTNLLSANECYQTGRVHSVSINIRGVSVKADIPILEQRSALYMAVLKGHTNAVIMIGKCLKLVADFIKPDQFGLTTLLVGSEGEMATAIHLALGVGHGDAVTAYKDLLSSLLSDDERNQFLEVLSDERDQKTIVLSRFWQKFLHCQHAYQNSV